ncbi:citrate lyase ACP [Arsenicicoccus sp. oral taxon 190]|uniref:citrate lyase ACP n=1 Tax=Arsenicicoccus sp. oral taxon 190 TaxID=1658671 RepID=UPI00067A2C00|nr:citrate lyase acyl carrier protein [Arsenicicoccus sp. oral taxon 190]AKT52107.1 hypothetical protein ADJ73_13955 [Arsenicicoccus sp. oral taxon 190]
MRIVHEAIAGTLESSDVMVTVLPPPGRQAEESPGRQAEVSPEEPETLDVIVTSAVMAQFGHQIRAVVDEVLAALEVTAGQVVVDDKGALDWAIRARLQAALLRACDADPDWAALAEARA